MRSDAREAACQIVCARLFHGDSTENFRNALYKKANLNKEETAFAERLVALATEHEAEFLELLTQKVTGYSEQRIYPADKAAMLVALAEIKYCDDVPPVVSVSEATAIAKKYSAENSAAFVNGVLGGIINS